jgi:hypothetical protein
MSEAAEGLYSSHRMRVLAWLWDAIKNLFTKKPIQEESPTLVELKPATTMQPDDPMECLEGFINITLTV